ncbi:MAG: hypothetical protein LUE08_07190 [Akkermansiaceae bacterium]|nr:hypothetical protein [Akkermansiaceae bacterium]
MGSIISNLLTGSQEKKAARAQAEAERQAALEDVTITSQGEEVAESNTEADHDAADAEQNKKARRASISKTVNTSSQGVMGGMVSGRQTLGGS